MEGWQCRHAARDDPCELWAISRLDDVDRRKEGNGASEVHEEEGDLVRSSSLFLSFFFPPALFHEV